MSSIVIHQPEYFPWINLFFKMLKCDKFIFLDNVQYLRRGFQNRNIIGNNGRSFYITVPTKYAPRETLIREIEIDNSKKWIEEHVRNLHNCYKKTKFFKSIILLLENEYAKSYKYLNDLNQGLIKMLAKNMEIKCKFFSSSDLNADGKKSELIFNICEKAGALKYITGTDSANYLDEEKFKKNRIEIMYLKKKEMIYPQKNSEKKFIKDLSVLDFLFNLGFEGFKKIKI